MQETHDAKSHDYATDSNPYANFDFAQTVAARSGTGGWRTVLRGSKE